MAVAQRVSLDDFDRSAASRTAGFATQNKELSDRFARGAFEGDQATVDIHAEGMAPMLGAFRRVGLKAYLLEAVDRYSQAAAHAGFGPQDVSVIFDKLRTRTL